jgi:hypothetical protein
MSTAVIPIDEQRQLVRDLAQYTLDPLGAVLYGFTWGKGELAGFQLRKWQAEELAKLGKHLQNRETQHKLYPLAISSGHGPGKTTFSAFLAWWALSTFDNAMVRVTANTADQLDKTTSPEFARWFRRALNKDWFDVHVSSIKANERETEQTWRLDFQPWSDDNPQAFAGKHNAGRRMVFILEEASEISDEIVRVARGALTDANTEKILLLIGNCTRNIGAFYEAVFGSQRSRWNTRIIDSRDVEGCDVEEINGWLAECEGNEDADYFRVRARGLFPKGAAGQFIDLDTIRKAQERQVVSLPDDVLVAGCDLSWGGTDDSVVRFRKGLDARSIPAIKVKGEFTRDPAVMIGKLTDVLTQTYNGEKVAMLFVDAAGAAGPVVGTLRYRGFKNVVEVNFGADATDSHYAYRRDEMWGKMKQALIDGLAIDKDPGLAADLAKPMLVSDNKQRVKLESKEVMMRRLSKSGIEASSPDDGDALALTFAQNVAPPKPKSSDKPPKVGIWS